MDYPPHDLPIEMQNSLVLGYFLDEWSALERMCVRLAMRLLDSDYETAATIFFNTSGPHQYRLLLEGLIEFRCTQTQKKEISRVLGRIKKYATKRNKIVHGEWRKIYYLSGPIEYRRAANSHSQEKRKAVLNDDSLRNEEWFTQSDIVHIAKCVAKLRADIEAVIVNNWG